VNLLKRNSIALVFTALTAMPLLLSVYFHISKYQIRGEMKEALEKAHLQQLSIVTSEIIWLKEGAEILVNGEPFDVKTFGQKDSITILTGLFDKKEKELNSRAIAYSKQHTPNQQHILKAFFLCLFLHNGNNSPVYYIHFQQKKVYGIFRSNKINLPFPSITAPPPEKGFPCNSI
jgi:hypothetical protein